jgi:2-polyprenyl-6-methoxyphenol hydroxylase-like FAD-dependent oxidoreductase
MKAVISGAGIAGLTLATCLGRQGWDVTLLDKAPATRDEGYMIDLFGSGFEVARRMELMPRLRELGYELDAIEWRNPGGDVAARLAFRTIRDLLQGRLLSLMRGDLERTLVEQLPRNVELRFERSVTHVRTPKGAVEAILSSGEVERGDVLVGADGLQSRIRDLVFGDGAQWFRFMGFHTGALVFQDPALHASLNNDLRVVSVPGRQVGFYPLRDDKIAVTFVHRASHSAPPRSPVEVLAQTYGDLDAPVRNALKAAENAPDLHYRQVGQVRMPEWCRGRIALLGDACQAVSLLPGQGASLSMAAAFVLAEELSAVSPVNAALAAYEHRVRPMMTRMRRSTRRAAEWLVPATATGLMARNAAIRLATVPGLTRMFRPAANAASENVLTAPSRAPRGNSRHASSGSALDDGVRR